MSQLSPAGPIDKSSTPQPSSAIFQAVLGSLDVQLEDELARYRRRRSSKAVPNIKAGSAQTKKTLDLISLKGTVGSNESSGDGELVSESLPPSVGNFNPTVVQAGGQNEPPDAYNQGQAIQKPEIDLDSNQSDRLEPFPSGREHGAHLVNPNVAPMGPNDYLESSEALLKNLNGEKAPQPPERSFTESILTPLGIGSMLLLLLSSATLGYVAMNPSSLSHLSWKELFASRTVGDGKNPGKIANGGERKAGEGMIPNSPNLAAEEFVDLNLRSLSTINPKNLPKSQPLVTPNPQIPVKQPAPLPSPVASPLDLSSALLPPSIQSGVLPQITTRSSSPLPPPPTIVKQSGVAKQPVAAKSNPAMAKLTVNKAPAQKPPAAKAKAAPSKENKFLVVMSYNGDRSLVEARKVVPDAHVHNGRQGKGIQLAAFPTESEAKKKVAALQKQGISAQVYPR